MQPPSNLFLKGDKIEVRDRNGAVSWRTATFLRSTADQIVHVRYDGDDRTICVGAAAVRPVPPSELHRYYRVGEKVEGFCRVRYGWRDAQVVEIMENSRYKLLFDGEGQNGQFADVEGQKGQFAVGEGQKGQFAVVEQWELRGVTEWCGVSSWVPPRESSQMAFEHSKFMPRQEMIDGKLSSVSKVNLTDANLKPNKVNLKRKYSDEASEATFFKDGMLVEVKSDEEGYQGSWYTAKIVSSLAKDQFTVEYQTLKNEDKSARLREIALASYIRPYPPVINQRKNRFKPFEEVDAWYNDGWWVGEISKALEGGKYSVYFGSTNEIMEFQQSQLRPHQDWINGQWVVAKKGLKSCSEKKLKK